MDYSRFLFPRRMKTAWSVTTAVHGVMMTGNATTVTIAAKVRVHPAMKNITAVIAVRVMTITNCVMTAEIALRIIANVRKNAADVMKWAKPSARTAAKNAPDAVGSATSAANVQTVSVMNSIAPPAIFVSSAQNGFVIAERAAIDVLSVVRTAMRFAVIVAALMLSAMDAGTVLIALAAMATTARDVCYVNSARTISATAAWDASNVYLSVNCAAKNAKYVQMAAYVKTVGFAMTVSAVMETFV